MIIGGGGDYINADSAVCGSSHYTLLLFFNYHNCYGDHYQLKEHHKVDSLNYCSWLDSYIGTNLL